MSLCEEGLLSEYALLLESREDLLEMRFRGVLVCRLLVLVSIYDYVSIGFVAYVCDKRILDRISEANDLRLDHDDVWVFGILSINTLRGNIAKCVVLLLVHIPTHIC